MTKRQNSYSASIEDPRVNLKTAHWSRRTLQLAEASALPNANRAFSTTLSVEEILTIQPSLRHQQGQRKLEPDYVRTFGAAPRAAGRKPRTKPIQIEALTTRDAVEEIIANMPRMPSLALGAIGRDASAFAARRIEAEAPEGIIVVQRQTTVSKERAYELCCYAVELQCLYVVDAARGHLVGAGLTAAATMVINLDLERLAQMFTKERWSGKLTSAVYGMPKTEGEGRALATFESAILNGIDLQKELLRQDGLDPQFSTGHLRREWIYQQP